MTAVARSTSLAWDAIETVVLDMDGTLLDLNFDAQVWSHALPRRYAERTNATLNAASTLVKGKLNRARGTLQWYCLDHWSAEFGINISELEGELAHLIQVRPGAIEFLEKIRKRGCHVVLATNAHPDSLARKLQTTGIGHYFDVVVSAHHLGAPKEDKNFWHLFAARFGVNKSRAVLIDDNHEVLKAARHSGVAHLRGIRMPNSKGKELQSREFHCIDSFETISPPIQTPRPGLK